MPNRKNNKFYYDFFKFEIVLNSITVEDLLDIYNLDDEDELINILDNWDAKESLKSFIPYLNEFAMTLFLMYDNNKWKRVAKIAPLPSDRGYDGLFFNEELDVYVVCEAKSSTNLKTTHNDKAKEAWDDYYKKSYEIKGRNKNNTENFSTNRSSQILFLKKYVRKMSEVTKEVIETYIKQIDKIKYGTTNFFLASTLTGSIENQNIEDNYIPNKNIDHFFHIKFSMKDADEVHRCLSLLKGKING